MSWARCLTGCRRSKRRRPTNAITRATVSTGAPRRSVHGLSLSAPPRHRPSQYGRERGRLSHLESRLAPAPWCKRFRRSSQVCSDCGPRMSSCAQPTPTDQATTSESAAAAQRCRSARQVSKPRPRFARRSFRWLPRCSRRHQISFNFQTVASRSPEGPRAGVAIAKVVERAHELSGPVAGEGSFTRPGVPAMPGCAMGHFIDALDLPVFAVHDCEVAVDPDTGHVEVLSYSVVQDVGRAFNRRAIQGQIQGGVVQGLGLRAPRRHVGRRGRPCSSDRARDLSRSAC